MKLRAASLAVIALAAAACAQTPMPQAQAQTPQVPASTAAPVIFFDIAGPNLAEQTAFYHKVFNWTDAGQTYNAPQTKQDVNVPTSPALMKASLRTDSPEKVIYIGVPDITETLKKVVQYGGRVEAERYEIKGVVVMGMFYDPAGNRMGLVELSPSGAPKVP